MIHTYRKSLLIIQLISIHINRRNLIHLLNLITLINYIFKDIRTFNYCLIKSYYNNLYKFGIYIYNDYLINLVNKFNNKFCIH